MVSLLLLNLTEDLNVFFSLVKVLSYNLFHIIETGVMLLLHFLKLLHLFIYVLAESVILHLSGFVLSFQGLGFCSVLH